MIRIAWYDRKRGCYDFGTNHGLETLREKEKWVNEQNKKFMDIFYWIELVEKDVSNNIIKVKNYITEEESKKELDFVLI